MDRETSRFDLHHPVAEETVIGGSIFRDREGKALARTVFDSSAPQTSQFTLLSSEDLAISPWLMAMVSHYHAMAIVAGSGSM